MTIWFLRHGQSQANLEDRFAGRRDDSPLTDLGRSQALAAAAALSPGISGIVCSPLRRATETAALIRRELGIQHWVEIDERLAGHDMGDATGLPKRILSATEMVELFGAETREPSTHALRRRRVPRRTRSGPWPCPSQAGTTGAGR
jgi:probable phosphoglycerate mutase